MICPQCGYDMGNKNKCLRCGYEVKTLVPLSEEESKKREREQTKVIDPNNTYLTDEYGNPVDDDDDGYADPFSSIFDDLFGFDPISDLLGGLFGVDVRPQYSAHSKKTAVEDKENDDNVVEVKKVEYLDENGEPVKRESKLKQTAQKVKSKVQNAVHGKKHKNNGHKK